MNKTAAQAKAAATTRSNATVLQRQNTLGAHVCVQREAAGHGVQPGAAPLARNVLNSPGEPIDTATRSVMEPRLGHDFSQVRVHTDSQAAESALAMGANAYTAGTHVAFGAGKYEPRSQEGQRILAHELTHVVQQSSGPVTGAEFAPGFYVSHPADSFEKEAAGSGGAAAPQAGQPAAPLAPAGKEAGAAHIQRDFLGLSSDQLAGIGAAAGIASLGFAAFAYFRPPEALNPAPVTGGLSINPNPFSFNTVQQTPAMPQVTPVKEPPSHRAQFLQAQRGAPVIHPVIDLRTDDDNHAVINLAERHDGLNIVDASIRTGTMEKYLGGSRGSSAALNFSAFQTPPAGADLFSAPEPGTPQAATPATPQAQAPATPQQQAQTPAATQTPAVTQTPASPTTQAPEPAEVTISYTGTNAKDQGAPQNFAGSFTVGAADGSVDVADPEVTNGVGRASKAANVAYIDYRNLGGSRGSSSSSGAPLVTPGSGEHHDDGGFDPGSLLPVMHPNTPWTGS